MKHNFLLYVFSSLALSLIFLFQFISDNVSIQMDLLGWSFFVTSCISHAATLLLIPYLLIGLLLSRFVRSENVSLYIYAVVNSLMLILALLDSQVFNLYKFHINGFVMGMLFGEGAAEIFSFDAEVMVKSLLIGAAVVAFTLLLARLSKFILKRKAKAYAWPVCLSLVAVTLFAQGLHVYGAAVRNRPVIKSKEYLPYYFPLSANRFMIKLGVIDPTIVNRMKISDNSSDIQYPLSPMVYDNDSVKPYNIVLITIDAWNYRTFTQACVPNITKFATQSRYYANHLSCSNGTTSAIFGLFTGIPAYYWVDFELAGKSPVLIDRLTQLDYSIQMFPSATICNPPFNKVLFHTLEHINTSTEGETNYDRDSRLTHNFINYIDSVKQQPEKPFFTWLFYDLAHSCRLPKDKVKVFRPSWEFADYTALNNNTDPEEFFNLYRNCVFHVDSLVGITLEKLEKEDLLKNTIVMITGDHGQEFNENHKNFWGHNGNFSRAQVGVPFVYYAPDIEPGVVSYKTSHYDVTATLLNRYLGARNPIHDYSMGHLFDDPADRNWLIVGSRDNYAFIQDGQILEKRPTGALEATNDNLDPLPDSSIDFKQLNEALKTLNSYYKEYK